MFTLNTDKEFITKKLNEIYEHLVEKEYRFDKLSNEDILYLLYILTSTTQVPELYAGIFINEFGYSEEELKERKIKELIEGLQFFDEEKLKATVAALFMVELYEKGLIEKEEILQILKDEK